MHHQRITGRRIKHAAAAAAITAGFALAAAGCGSQQDCIVLALGGNKLCGSDAAAWCRSTDGIRKLANQYDAGIDQSAQDACNQLESEY